MANRITLAALGALAATPALAAEGPFFTMQNPLFNVTVGFVLFVALLLYLKVPKLISGMLQKRADGIRAELEEARSLREEAQSILASYERKQGEVRDQAERIVKHAREEAELAAEQARKDLKESIARRLAAAEEQIESAKTAAVREVRDTAAQVATAAAGEVIAKTMKATDANKLIDQSIKEAEARLH